MDIKEQSQELDFGLRKSNQMLTFAPPSESGSAFKI